MFTTEEKRALRQAYSAIPTGNISDAMDALGMARTSIPGLTAICEGKGTVVGFAHTIQQARRQSAFDGKSLGRHGGIIDRNLLEGDVVVIEMAGIMDASTGGSIQAMLAKKRGAAGYVTNGCVRDAAEIRAIGLPLYSKGTIPVRSVQDLETIGENVPVCMEGVLIRPGDLMVMDDTGVICIPADWAAEVLEQAHWIQEKEKKILEVLEAGGSLAEARDAGAAYVAKQKKAAKESDHPIRESR